MATPPGMNPGRDSDPNGEIEDDPDDDPGNDDDDDSSLGDIAENMINDFVAAMGDVVDQLANLIPAPPKPEPGGFDWAQITGPLTKFAEDGLRIGAAAVETKVSKNPGLQKIFGAGNLDTLFTGAHLKANGSPEANSYKHKRKKKKTSGSTALYVGGAALLAVGVAFASSRGKK